MINRIISFSNVFIFLLLSFQAPAFALTDPTRAPTAEDGSVPVEGVIVRGGDKFVFLSGQLIAEGDETIYGEMKEITFDNVSFDQDSKLVSQSLVTQFKTGRLD